MKGGTFSMRFFHSLLRPEENAGRAMRCVHRLWVFLWLTAFGLGIGLLSLYLTANSYASIDAQALWESYFKLPLLVVMDLLLPLLVVYLGFFLFARPWAAYLLSAVPFLGLALASYYKIQLRGDPVLASDLRLIRTAGGIMGNYTFELTEPVKLVIAGFVGMLIFSVVLLRRERMSQRGRLVGLMAMLTLTLASYFELYTSADIYEKTANNSLINPWSEVEIYLSRGTTYPFLYSVQDMFPNAPSGYRESEASSTLASYEDQDIPEGEKITVVGIMLEAFSDLTRCSMRSPRSTRSTSRCMSLRSAAFQDACSRIFLPAAQWTPNGAISQATASTRSSAAPSTPMSAISSRRAMTRSTATPAIAGSITAAT